MRTEFYLHHNIILKLKNEKGNTTQNRQEIAQVSTEFHEEL